MMGVIQRIRVRFQVAVLAGTAGAMLSLVCLPTLAESQGDCAADGANETRIMLLQAKPLAYAIIEAAGRDEQPRVRLAALEAAQHAPDAATTMAQTSLGDENPAVRFAALVTIGKLKLTRLAPAAADLMKDENASVRAAAIFALKRCGQDVDLTPLAKMLGSNKSSTRANAAMLIGQLGDPDAIEMLREMAAIPMPRVSPDERTWIRLQFAEAMIRLDDNDAEVLGTIRAAVYSNLDDVRILAMQILGEIGDKTVSVGLTHITTRDNPIQIKIAAARALAQMGVLRSADVLMDGTRYDAETLKDDLEDFLDDNGAVDAQTQAIQTLLEDEKLRTRVAAEIRAQAVVALAFVDTKASVRRMAELLEDSDPIVRVAAASAVLQAGR